MYGVGIRGMRILMLDEVIRMIEIVVKIDTKGRIWYNGMRYYSEEEIHGGHWNEHPENEEYQPTEEEIEYEVTT